MCKEINEMIDYLQQMRVMTSTLLDCIDTLDKVNFTISSGGRPELTQVLNSISVSQNDIIENLINGLEQINTLRNET